MCVIVDACRLSAVFGDSKSDAGKTVLDWLLKGSGTLVYDDALSLEIRRVHAAAKILTTLKQAGKAKKFDVGKCPPKVSEAMVSNDQHVISLALVSGARVLYTGDDDLMKDFKNPKIVKKPRGRIFTRPEQKRLLRHDPGCPIKMGTRARDRTGG